MCVEHRIISGSPPRQEGPAAPAGSRRSARRAHVALQRAAEIMGASLLGEQVGVDELARLRIALREVLGIELDPTIFALFEGPSRRPGGKAEISEPLWPTRRHPPWRRHLGARCDPRKTPRRAGGVDLAKRGRARCRVSLSLAGRICSAPTSRHGALRDRARAPRDLPRADGEQVLDPTPEICRLYVRALPELRRRRRRFSPLPLRGVWPRCARGVLLQIQR